MAIKYGFFNSVDGDRKYNADDIGRYLHGIVSSGVYADTSSSLQVLARDAMTTTLQPGRAMLDYHYAENDAPMVLSHSAADTQDRYDAIVLRLDVSNRKIVVAINKGTPAASPTVPTVTRSDTTKEYMLAHVRIRAHATAITQEDITDTRPDNSVCGWVHGLIQQVDTSTLHKQYEDAYAKKMAELDAYIKDKKADIDSRLASIDSAINAENVVGVPIPTASNAGQVPVVNSTGSGYVLGSKSVREITVQFDTDGYYIDVNKYDPGLYIFSRATDISAPALQVRLQNSAGKYEAVGEEPTGRMFCLITKSDIYQQATGGYNTLRGYSHKLYDFANGMIYSNNCNLDGDWLYTVDSRLAKADT